MAFEHATYIAIKFHRVVEYERGNWALIKKSNINIQNFPLALACKSPRFVNEAWYFRYTLLIWSEYSVH